MDTIKIGDLTLEGRTFGETTKEPGVSFVAAQFDGILGMAWPKASMGKIPTVFAEMCKKGVIEECSFAFYLNPSGTTGCDLALGGFDAEHADGDFKYYDLAGEDYWRVSGDFAAGSVSSKD